MDWFLNNFGGVITTVLAVYGAVLSSLNFWHTRKRDKKELHIEAISKPLSDNFFDYVRITVANKSLRPIAIKEIGLEYKPSFKARLSKPVGMDRVFVRMPAKLETSDLLNYDCNCRYHAGKNEDPYTIEASAVPYVIDTEGQRYKGAPLKHLVYFIHTS